MISPGYVLSALPSSLSKNFTFDRQKKNVARQMLANPKVEICAYDQGKGVWLRIEAKVVPDERLEAKQYVLDQYPQLKSMYKADDDNTLVLYLKDATATFNSFSTSPRTVTF